MVDREDSRHPALRLHARDLRQLQPPVAARRRVRLAVQRELRKRHRLPLKAVLLLIPGAAAATLGVQRWVVDSSTTAPPAVDRPDASRRAQRGAQRALPKKVPAAAAATSRPVETPRPVSRRSERMGRVRRVSRSAGPPVPVEAPTAVAEPSGGDGSLPAGVGPVAPRDELGAQVAAYRRAHRLATAGRIEAAVEAWRAMRRRWPDSVLAHEVDLRLVRTLLRLGDRQAARREARRFLARYPDSPRAAEVRALGGAAGPAQKKN